MKYCDDINCPNFQYTLEEDCDCALGFKNRLRFPRNMADAVYHNWGYVMPKICKMKLRKQGINSFTSVASSKGAITELLCSR